MSSESESSSAPPLVAPPSQLRRPTHKPSGPCPSITLPNVRMSRSPSRNSEELVVAVEDIEPQQCSSMDAVTLHSVRECVPVTTSSSSSESPLVSTKRPQEPSAPMLSIPHVSTPPPRTAALTRPQHQSVSVATHTEDAKEEPSEPIVFVRASVATTSSQTTPSPRSSSFSSRQKLPEADASPSVSFASLCPQRDPEPQQTRPTPSNRSSSCLSPSCIDDPLRRIVPVPTVMPSDNQINSVGYHLPTSFQQQRLSMAAASLPDEPLVLVLPSPAQSYVHPAYGDVPSQLFAPHPSTAGGEYTEEVHRRRGCVRTPLTRSRMVQTEDVRFYGVGMRSPPLPPYPAPSVKLEDSIIVAEMKSQAASMLGSGSVIKPEEFVHSVRLRSSPRSRSQQQQSGEGLRSHNGLGHSSQSRHQQSLDYDEEDCHQRAVPHTSRPGREPILCSAWTTTKTSTFINNF